MHTYIVCYISNNGSGYHNIYMSKPRRHHIAQLSHSRLDPPSAPVVVGEKPIIIAHPQSQYVESGDPLTLTCRADSSGQGELTYLWYFNGLSLTKENQHEYFIHFFTDEDEGVYFCKISNRWGEVNTDMAHVQIKEEEEEED